MKKKTLRKIFPFLEWGKDLNKKTVWQDFVAGLTGAIVVLPQGIAFAFIAGMPPECGLYTAMLLPLVTALFGSSRHLVTGPATAMCIVIFASISQFAEPGSDDFIRLVFALTLLTGIIQVVFGVVQLGGLINFVSNTVIIGFTAGAAVLIATSQIPDALGIVIPKGLNFFEKWVAIFSHAPDINHWVLGVSVSSLVVAALFKKFLPKLPWLLIAMLAGGMIALLSGGAEVGIEFVSGIERKLPPFNLPRMNFEEFQKLAPNAFALALLGLISSVAISRSIATKSKQKLDGNQEFVGQGLANIVGSLFSGFAGAGSFSRSGVNYEAGAKTPLAQIFATLLLVAVVLILAPYTAYIPIPAMAGVIVLVAFNLIDFHNIKKIAKSSKEETVILVVTFLSTLLLELQFAIYMGIFFSLLFYLRKTSKPRIVSIAPDPKENTHRFTNVEMYGHAECPQVKVIRIDGSMFFGAMGHVEKKLAKLRKDQQPHLLIVANGINMIDIQGAELLVREAEELRKAGGGLYLSNLKFKARKFLQKGGYMESIGEENIFTSKKTAIPAIYKKLNRETCNKCTARIFFECNGEVPQTEG